MFWANIAIANIVKESYFCIKCKNKGDRGYTCN